MPELPEVETVKRGLQPIMEGAILQRLALRRSDLRFPFPDHLPQHVEGRKIVSLGRRAKFLTIDFEDGGVLICHLGMSGSFRIVENTHNCTPGSFHYERPRNEKHDHVVFHLLKSGGHSASNSLVIYNDPRRFGYIQFAQRKDLSDHRSFRHLGPEPTGNSLNAQNLVSGLARRKSSIKASLLDQKIVAGLGNIYVCEALWRSGISPIRTSGSLVATDSTPTDALERLVLEIRNVIQDAIEAGGSSLQDHAKADGTLGYFQHQFAVYGKESHRCQRSGCKGYVQRIVQSGRSTFYCPTCQK